MLAGAIVNSCFDALLENPDTDFDAVFLQALRHKPLVTIAGLGALPDAEALLRQKVRTHFEALRAIVPSLEADRYFVEPSFISPVFGLQGRLDVLLEYTAQTVAENGGGIEIRRRPQAGRYVAVV